ncbi:hypothetical protein HYH03_002842 [Edaphochlamys debaryana]|uniref:Uncharacterized protein n=1 Tax=Edaphochlamys debaryana TaxID=47281 RepID=A0A835YKB7_9CHLO|nr:hypothetical protein HYH03_002842 [Edaphochlamys debaryana]|eukprot:KAG2499264.1 hypothetical protein HYH03_002842 [Edaphochlamys debaryana]
MQVAREDEHEFFWGQPSRKAASAAPSRTAADTRSPEASATGTGFAAVAEVPTPAVVPLDVPPEAFHRIAGAASVEQLLGELSAVLEGAGPGAALPARVVEVAAAKTASWVLDPGAFAGTDPGAVRRVLGLLQHSMRATRLTGYDVDDVGSVLWSLASALGAYGWSAPRSSLGVVVGWLAGPEAAALLEGCGGFGQLVSVLWGYSALLQAAEAGQQADAEAEGAGEGVEWDGAEGRRLAAPAAAGRRLGPEHLKADLALLTQPAGPSLDALARRLAELLPLSYGAGEPVAAAELTDCAWALSVIGRRSPATAQLAEAVAHEVYRQVSNRYSLQAPFAPTDLVKLVRAYARLELGDGSVARMLDAVATHVSKRIRSRHMHSLTRVGDCVELLQGYADTGHSSVVIPELIAAVGLQVCRELAAHNEALAPTAAPEPTAPPGSGASAAQRMARPHVPLWRRLQPLDPGQLAANWEAALSPEQGRELLSACVRMGYYPGAVLVDTVLMAVVPQLPYAGPEEAAQVLTLLAQLRHVPGQQTLSLLAQAALQPAVWAPSLPEEGAEPEDEEAAAAAAAATGAVQRLRSLWCLTMMGLKPEPETVSQVLRGVLREEGPELSTVDAGRLLSLLCVLPRRELTIQRLGLSTLALREAVARSTSEASGGTDREAVMLAAGAAMALMGPEGWEMAEQILPTAGLRRSEAALRRALARPYEGVDERCVELVAQALGSAPGCVGVSDRCLTPVWPPPDAEAATEAEGEVDSEGLGAVAAVADAAAALDEEEGFAPLECRALSARVRLPPRDEGAASTTGAAAAGLADFGLREAEIAGSARARTEGVQAESQGAERGRPGPEARFVVDMCLPADYAANGPGRVLWGWCRVRQALYSMCTGGVVMLLDERTLYSLQASRERLDGYVAGALARAP